MRLLLLIGAVALIVCPITNAAAPIEVDVWPDRPPDTPADEKLETTSVMDKEIGIKITKVSRPTVTVYPTSSRNENNPAIIVCPGGGYHILAWDLEGVEVARWLNRIGMTAIVLKYRVPRSKSEPHFLPPLRDAQRALRLARFHADDWKIDAQRIGMLGFSAGGNLAALVATNAHKPVYKAIDDVDKLSCRPDFGCLIYPAYLTKRQGPGVTDLELQDHLPVTANTPPMFLVHTGDDAISAANSLGFYLALKNHDISAELHLYPSGGHGYGLRPSAHAVSSWPDRSERWFQTIGILESAP